MTSFIAFLKKEWIAQRRTGKLLILGGIFLALGVMNPATAKLTPMIFEMLEEELAMSGIVIPGVTVSALDSWVQFFKNIPMGLIAFVVLESNLFTKEYRTGTLILSLTKGLARRKVVLAKALVLATLWTAGYWLCFAVTYGGTALLWDNSVAQHLLFAALCWWVFGVMVVALTVLSSVLFSSNVGVLCGTGGVAMGAYLLSALPKIGEYSPAYLANGAAIIYGSAEIKDFLPSLLIAAIIGVAAYVVSIPLFNKKQL